ncbi:unnamed protein product [Mytilus coruscus]|uniref:Uncharacterized protein n=1 Tax=Mytilus coruscus TaxID=42192 RepID=A0A6J8DL28_MYTCO|nr:unnamed protein product [Mytilus coruscus]
MDGDDDRLNSDSREAPEFSLLSADTAGDKLKKKSSSKSSARTSSLEKVCKKKRTSKKDALQAVYDEKLTNMENNFNAKYKILKKSDDNNGMTNEGHEKSDERQTTTRNEQITTTNVNVMNEQVPKLDDLLEPMIRQTHGQKLIRFWDNHRQLYSQPYKQIEKLGFQGQLASRMNIISMLYMQQALGSLLKDLEEDDVDKSTACQTVKDIFAMSTKSLDQAGRSGAFNHLIRRKAAAHDSEGVFGKGLEISLEKRKEQKEQLSDLLPEFSKKKKFEDSRLSSNKSARFSNQGARPTQFQNTSSGYTSNNNRKPVSTYNSYNSAKDKDGGSNRQEGNKKDFKVGKTTTKSSWGSFRIPKWNDS